MNRFLRCMIPGLTVACFALSAGFADAQVVYYSTLRPVVAAPLVAAPVAAAPAYVAHYTPTGNYAAVTQHSLDQDLYPTRPRSSRRRPSSL